MARYKPVFAPWIATIRKPTGIKLNCAKRGEQGARGEAQQRERQSEEMQARMHCNNTHVKIKCHVHLVLHVKGWTILNPATCSIFLYYLRILILK